MTAVYKVCVAIGLLTQCSAAAVIFVDGRATQCGNGQSWATAYRHLQDALTAARNSAGTIDEIWVATGTYRPDQDCVHPNGTRDRTASFRMITGVAIRGGFAGMEDPSTFDLASRDLAAYPTLLSGDLAGNDGPDFANNDENSYHVVKAGGTLPSALLDGFTVTAGNADYVTWDEFILDNRGGGLHNVGGNPTLVNCTFTANSAASDMDSAYGAGVYNENGSPTLTNCTFSENRMPFGGYGAGMYNENSSPTLTNCFFSDNSMDGGDGAGMYNLNSSPTLTNCTFSTNMATNGSGGAISNYNSSPVLSNCTFDQNVAAYGGGAISTDGGSLVNCTFSDNRAERGGGIVTGNSTLTNCTFTKNSANMGGGGCIGGGSKLTNCVFSQNDADLGGGIYSIGYRTARPTLANCTFTSNQAGTGGGFYNDADSQPTLTSCTFEDNSADKGGGLGLAGGTVTLMTCTFTRNLAEFTGGAIVAADAHLSMASCTLVHNLCYQDGGAIWAELIGGTLRDCRIEENSARGSGGAVLNRSDSLDLMGCRIAGNWTLDFGGAVSNVGGHANLTNCLLIGGYAAWGAGLENCDGTVTATNCTFAANDADHGGEDIYSWAYGQVNLANTIVASSDSQPIVLAQGGALMASFSDIRGGTAGVLVGRGSDLSWGEGNINADPLFVRSPSSGPDGFWGTADDDYGDLRLQSGSPCVDAGSNAAVPLDTSDIDADGNTSEPIPFDVAGLSRFIDDPLTADMGLGMAPIVDIGAYEFDPPPLPDADGDGVPDAHDQCPGTVQGVLVNTVGCPPPIPGDLDMDGDVDPYDLTEFTACSLGPGVQQDDPKCLLARLDSDEDVDSADFAILQRCLSGQNRPANPSCAN